MFEIVKYILMMMGNKSTTWSAHLRMLCIMYGLPDPLRLMSTPPTKSEWQTLTQTKVTVYHEQRLRKLAEGNSKMKFLLIVNESTKMNLNLAFV